MDDLLSEFLIETAEKLDVIDTELVRFESQPQDMATLNNIFRLVHTIKGTCGFIGLPRLESIAHAGETFLGKFRDGALPVTPDAVTLVLASTDRIKLILTHLAAEQVEPPGDDCDLIAKLQYAAGCGQIAAVPPPAPVIVAATPEPESDEEQGRWDADQRRFLRPGEVSLADLEAAFNATEGPEQVETKPVAAAGATMPDQDDSTKTALGANSIRVNVDVLESLMTMVSELVLTRNQLLQILRNSTDSEFRAPLQRLSSVTAELRECVMKTRMQPIGSAWKKLPRIVRDASNDLHKKIELVMEGETTELHCQVLELIKDPLTHMIRNSCDHGVETTAQRIAGGKSENGTIKLKAYHESGHILIEVSDDGAGLNTDRIRSKAIEKGVIDIAESMAMTDAQIHRLIFAPGFSTAAKVTNISGRGVGMDVVKTNIELIGGAIDLRSRQGHGTTFIIKIPLTRAIISSLIVGVEDQEMLDIQLGDQSPGQMAPGILGTAVLKGKSTEIIDVGHFLSQAEPTWASAALESDLRANRKRVLLIETHPFFRNLLAPMVTAAGYDVTVADGLEEARACLAAGATFDVVLTDADSPIDNVAGARIIPLSSRRDAAAVPKSDRYALLDAIQRALRGGEAA